MSGSAQIGTQPAASAVPTATEAIAPGKPDYVVLDGLRGVAALLVVALALPQMGDTPHP